MEVGIACSADLQIGDLVEGRVISSSQEGAWIDIGRNLPALLPASETSCLIAEGDNVELVLASVADQGQWILSMRSRFEGSNRSTSSRGRGRGMGRGYGRRQILAQKIALEPTCSDVPFYSRGQLLDLYRKLAHEKQLDLRLSCLPALAPYAPEELESAFLECVNAGELPPRCWKQCSPAVKRRALLSALRSGHMHIVFAMQPQSQRFREDLSCVDLDEGFLLEAMTFLCADAHGAGFDHAQRPCIAWLLEQGSPVGPLLPAHSVQSRLGGLKLLASLGPSAEAALPDLVQCVTDDDARVRRAAVETIGNIGLAAGDSSETAAVLAKRLEDPNLHVRAAASVALGRVGLSGIELAGAALSNGSPDVRGLAAEALGVAGPAAAIFANALLNLLEDDMGALRVAAAQALGLIGPAVGPGAAAALGLRLREDPDEHVREAAVLALGRLREVAVPHIAEIANAFDDPAPFVQHAASATIESLMQLQAH